MSNKYTNKILNHIERQVYVPQIDTLKYPLLFDFNKVLLETVGPYQYTETHEYQPKIHDDKYPLIWKQHKFNDFKQFLRDTRHFTLDITDYKLTLPDTISENRRKLHDVYFNNHFVGIDTIYHAETSNIDYYNIKYKDADIKLYIVEGVKKPDVNKIIHIIEFIYRLSKKYKQDKKQDKLPELTFFVGKQKKKLPMGSKTISIDNVNSGCTSFYPENNITIWREEEMYKVLIHELIHYFHFDFFSNPNHKVTKHVKQQFCFDGDDASNESYTETLAVLINCMFVSHYYQLDFITLFINELQFSVFQVAKLLHFFEIEKLEDIIKDDKCISNINQKTSVLSYFVIKTSFLFNLTNFFKFINNNVYIGNKFDSFNKLITESMKNTDFISSVNNINKELLDGSNFVHWTLRMTCWTL